MVRGMHHHRFGYVATALLVVGVLSGCSGTKSRSAWDYENEICPALSSAINAGASGDGATYQSGMSKAVSASEQFRQDYPDNKDAAWLLAFTRKMRDVPAGGYQGSEEARARALFTRVGAICGVGH